MVFDKKILGAVIRTFDLWEISHSHILIAKAKSFIY